MQTIYVSEMLVLGTYSSQRVPEKPILGTYPSRRVSDFAFLDTYSYYLTDSILS